MLTARLRRLNLSKGDWVLDLGCGEGRHCHGVHMRGGVHVVGLDIDLPSIRKAVDGVEFLPERLPEQDAATSFIVGDAYRLPFADDTFDAVICSEVLEHLPEYQAVVGEIRRVLKRAGRFCATVPHAWPEELCWKLAPPPDGYPFQPGGHIRIFNDVDLRTSIQRAGFRYHGKHHAHGLHSPYWWLKCLFWTRRDSHPWIKLYHRLLVWDIMKRPLLTRVLEAVTSPFIGKSVALYFGPERSK